MEVLEDYDKSFNREQKDQARMKQFNIKRKVSNDLPNFINRPDLFSENQELKEKKEP
eukprot:CAMPEP_0170562380 /NCGR_PEP_ID=MMETSP0211-20121228/60169_1 /TAXON_ID=311385 /ORGANISM="Pseudokeronopsis sp., Strain OXSARD2" /LENGTH=56 /DNA_ID=CAMNT_0010879165 /DNA_START=173 /DNA_END=343 /DNA_ORIENTATION=+